MEREQAINNKKTIIQAAALILPSLILIYKQPNLSNTICLATVFCIMLYMGGLSYKFIGTVLAITIPTAALFLTIVVQPNQPFLKDYQQARILAWLEPEKYATDEAYQQINSVMAIGSGQLSGKGYNSNTTTSVKNGNFISEPPNGFYFRNYWRRIRICGLLCGHNFVIINCNNVYFDRSKSKRHRRAAYLRRCRHTDRSTELYQYQCGYSDIPEYRNFLPFVSYGMTSVVCFYMGIGFVLNVGLQPNKYQ